MQSWPNPLTMITSRTTAKSVVGYKKYLRTRTQESTQHHSEAVQELPLIGSMALKKVRVPMKKIKHAGVHVGLVWRTFVVVHSQLKRIRLRLYMSREYRGMKRLIIKWKKYFARTMRTRYPNGWMVFLMN